MAIHQCIYTNAASGLERGGGAGVYSYSPGMEKQEELAFVKGYCSYPRKDAASGAEEDGPAGELPVKLLFGTVENGRKLIASVTYLGRDYTGLMGRMGNILSHMYSFDPGTLPDYPVRYYGSPSFRTSMETAEVDGSQPVRPLEQPEEVAVSGRISLERVQRFLRGEDGKKQDRMEMFCHLMAAVIERDSVHRVIIYDTHEHILLWIGALEYALPLKSAAAVSFSSYDYNPLLSDFEIRGCIPGMCKVDLEELKDQDQHFVFDGIHMEYPRFDISEDFYRYGMEVGMDFGYDSLANFHQFMKEYRYEKLDREIYQAFRLYQMKQEGFGRESREELSRVFSFELRYGSRETCDQLLDTFTDSVAGNPEEADEKIRDSYLDFIAGLGKPVMQRVSGKLCRMGAWDYLGKLQGRVCADAVSGSGQETGLPVLEEVRESYENFFRRVPEEERKAFDLVVQAVAEMLEERYPGLSERYGIQMELLLLVREMGGNSVHGAGMEKLIRSIDAGTLSLRPPRGFDRKKRNALAEKQKRCDEEIREYLSLWHPEEGAARLSAESLETDEEQKDRKGIFGRIRHRK